VIYKLFMDSVFLLYSKLLTVIRLSYRHNVRYHYNKVYRHIALFSSGTIVPDRIIFGHVDVG
jgi:hypothetical protein